MANRPHPRFFFGFAVLTLAALGPIVVGGSAAQAAETGATAALERLGTGKGVCAVIGLPETGTPDPLIDFVERSEWTVYFQSPRAEDLARVRAAAQDAGVLGSRVFVDRGDWTAIHLADNLADAVWVTPPAGGAVPEAEILRVLHPEGRALVGEEQIVKPVPQGMDVWSHPYHGPDNNPQSTDRFAKAPYLTQFLDVPKFCPMPEVTVTAGGRIFKAFGHIAHKANQNEWLNTLLCVNAYNGTILWRRDLKGGFMIHRNTMIATPDYLYMGDDRSCKRIDARTGEPVDEITIPEGLADGPVWKWMALQDGVLYALVGGEETPISTQPSSTPGMGHWPWGMWAGHDYSDPKTSLGFGRTFVAIDPETKRVKWSHSEDGYLDSRGVCMHGDRIFFYCPEEYLGCLDAETGKVLWENSSSDLLDAIGPNGRAQHYVTGYSTTTYMKCNADYLFFAGPQRSRLVVASADDGRLLWQKDDGNLQLVLRDDGFYAAGHLEACRKLDYATGNVLAELPGRRACTRATGSLDSVFFRTPGGTMRIDTTTNTAKHVAPMRPPCQDGVIISNGMLYWGPWMCGCQLSLYGHIGLAPAGDFDYRPDVDASRLEHGPGGVRTVEPLATRAGDWPAYCGDSGRTSVVDVELPAKVKLAWTVRLSQRSLPTAPVTSGGLVFVGDRSGVVRALDAGDGEVRWKSYTGGAVYFPPAVCDGRVYVGSADGRVYAFEAATGRLLWRFQAAPADRWISVFGNLISTWPVAGGVAVNDGTVYAAAGIAHYDGTYVYALDAVTGEVKWCNDTSGTLSKVVDSGVSVQGALWVADGELRFLGGNVHETARYDLETGRCLNEPHDVVNSPYRTAFYPYYPAYGKYLSLDCTLSDGRSLVYDASYEGSLHGPLTLLPPLPPGQSRPAKPAERWTYLARRQKPETKAVWQDKTGRRFSGFVVAGDLLLAAGEQPRPNEPQAFLAAVRIDDGSDQWRQQLPSPAVKGGPAVSHERRIFVSLEDGSVVCYEPGEG